MIERDHRFRPLLEISELSANKAYQAAEIIHKNPGEHEIQTVKRNIQSKNPYLFIFLHEIEKAYCKMYALSEADFSFGVDFAFLSILHESEDKVLSVPVMTQEEMNDFWVDIADPEITRIHPAKQFKDEARDNVARCTRGFVNERMANLFSRKRSLFLTLGREEIVEKDQRGQVRPIQNENSQTNEAIVAGAILVFAAFDYHFEKEKLESMYQLKQTKN
jgi:hypothetical protein